MPGTGNTAPPLHPNCRSTIVGSLYRPEKKDGDAHCQERKARRICVPADMTYKEWREKVTHGILFSESENVNGKVEQARKKNHLFLITDAAINKIALLNIFTSWQDEALQKMNQQVLRIAQQDNDSKEVLLISADTFLQNPVVIYGTGNSVDFSNNIEVAALKQDSYAGELVFSHNHPTTKSFSFADIALFVVDEYIGVFVVVTNQGQVNCLQKTVNFDYNKARELLNELYDKYEMGQFPDDEKRQESAAKDFLGQARKVGIRYVKAKE